MKKSISPQIAVAIIVVVLIAVVVVYALATRGPGKGLASPEEIERVKAFEQKRRAEEYQRVKGNLPQPGGASSPEGDVQPAPGSGVTR